MGILLLCAFLWPDPSPPVSIHDLGRFPPAAVCESRLAWYAERREFVVRTLNCGVFDHWGYLWAWQAQVDPFDRAAEVYHLLIEIHQSCDPRDQTRLLRRLCDQLGPEAYYAGQMPPLYDRSAIRER